MAERAATDFRKYLIWGCLAQIGLGIFGGSVGVNYPLAILGLNGALDQKSFILLWFMVFLFLSLIMSIIQVSTLSSLFFESDIFLYSLGGVIHYLNIGLTLLNLVLATKMHGQLGVLTAAEA